MYMYVKCEVPYDFLVGEMGHRIGIERAGVRNTAGRRGSTMGPLSNVPHRLSAPGAIKNLVR